MPQQERTICYGLDAAAESNDQAFAADEQVFPDYEQYDPGPVYECVADASHPSNFLRRNLVARPLAREKSALNLA